MKSRVASYLHMSEDLLVHTTVQVKSDSVGGLLDPSRSWIRRLLGPNQPSLRVFSAFAVVI